MKTKEIIDILIKINKALLGYKQADLDCRHRGISRLVGICAILPPLNMEDRHFIHKFLFAQLSPKTQEQIKDGMQDFWFYSIERKLAKGLMFTCYVNDEYHIVDANLINNWYDVRINFINHIISNLEQSELEIQNIV